VSEVISAALVQPARIHWRRLAGDSGHAVAFLCPEFARAVAPKGNFPCTKGQPSVHQGMIHNLTGQGR